ncbi:coiled-coil domain-containing protein 91 isoform X2 [Cricetulus griseus]|nr:coiled-coil domain-containing protein 91 isoform X2 [Cricetulus griseus]XP_027297754.1 coiled-coil domain-containing protein 91 isoform X2 [Cricetulus griseus]
MDDDDFGGFEAAETFDGEHSGNQAMSPAVPWATFPTGEHEISIVNHLQSLWWDPRTESLMPMWNKVSGVHLSPASPELILDHDHTSPSSGRLSSDAVISSPDDTRADSGLVSQTIPKAQIQQSAHTHLNIPLFPLGLTDEASHGSIALEDDPEGPGADVASAQLQQKISSLETKLKASEEEKLRIKKDVDSLMEKHSVLEEGFLKEKEQDAVSFQARYRELQVSSPLNTLLFPDVLSDGPKGVGDLQSGIHWKAASSVITTFCYSGIGSLTPCECTELTRKCLQIEIWRNWGNGVCLLEQCFPLMKSL